MFGLVFFSLTMASPVLVVSFVAVVDATDTSFIATDSAVTSLVAVDSTAADSAVALLVAVDSAAAVSFASSLLTGIIISNFLMNSTFWCSSYLKLRIIKKTLSRKKHFKYTEV